MNFFVVLQQMLALFAMIFIGFYAYKVHWVTQDTSDRLSKLLVNILNPALLINGVLDKTVVAKKTSCWKIFSISSFILCF